MKKIIHSSILGLALIISSVILGNSVVGFKMYDRTVTVKGLAEKNVKADFAIWRLPLSVSSDNLEEAKVRIENGAEQVISFLKKHKIPTEHIELGILKIHDKLAQRYYDPNNQALRYHITYELTVKSPLIDKVEKASKSLNELIKSNVPLASEGYNSVYPNYLFTGLNKIKPEMLAGASKEAKLAALEFAKNSGSKIGKIKRAYQGIFSIFSRENKAAEVNTMGAMGGFMGNNEAFYINKTVRVVTTVEYYLEN